MIASSAGPCPLCRSDSQVYLFIRHGAPVFRCADCGLARSGRRVEQTGCAPEADASSRLPLTSFTERRAADAYVASLVARRASKERMLAVVADRHPFLSVAAAQGFRIASRLDVRELERGELRGGPFDSAVVLFQIERTPDPLSVLERIHRALVPGGILLVVTPSLDSLPARLLRSQWTEWAPESRYYFDSQTIQSSLLRSGFADVEWGTDWRSYTLDHLDSRAAASMPTALTRVVCAGAPLVPAVWRRRLYVKLPASGVVVTARRADLPPRPVLSIVMPVFNECATFERTLNAVLDKECPGVDKEVVIVESRSTDGTRELVRKYEGRPGVTVIFEDRPRGKGAAVRTGLARATGTIILIQDADNEYDVNDYDALVEPIVSFQRAFVLGSRHLGTWKVRNFANQRAVSAFFNVGHIIFRTALNVIYRQKIKDPFTMYKVFRRDCLYRLKFECNRFDFDFELVIKLLRKGYVPLEIPVNYSSRSFKDGKKVSAFRDPVTWVRALIKYRFASIYQD